MCPIGAVCKRVARYSGLGFGRIPWKYVMAGMAYYTGGKHILQIFAYISSRLKSLHLILSIYIFILALYPCRDSDLNVDPIPDAIAILADHDHSHSGTEIDICTPFCICACCSAHIKLVDPDAVLTQEPQHNTLLISHYIERPMLDAASSIWQPPRA